MYHEGGPVDLEIKDPTVASQLLENANLWLRSFHDDPAGNAVPYSVTLAPTIIAEGPLPPDSAVIQHAQDVLVICAKQRTQILDQINLLSFILGHSGSYDWAGSPPASLTAALNGFQADLDLVAGCASLAINHPDQALTPADFAAARHQPYPAGALPAVMPQPNALALATAPVLEPVTVPDFLTCTSWEECLARASSATITLLRESAGNPGAFEVLSQSPAAGTTVTPGTSVRVQVRLPIEPAHKMLAPGIASPIPESSLHAPPH
jgi:hypothetical protein